jgi:hypothetical protein
MRQGKSRYFCWLLGVCVGGLVATSGAFSMTIDCGAEIPSLQI